MLAWTTEYSTYRIVSVPARVGNRPVSIDIAVPIARIRTVIDEDDCPSTPSLKPPRWFVPVVAIVVCLLTTPALFVGLHLDDWQQQRVLQGQYEFSDGSSPYLEYFTFANGNPQDNSMIIDRGVLPWWTSDHLRLRFLRPISVITHKLDLLLWPDHPSLSHAHSIFWYLMCIYAASLVYRRCGVTTLGVCLATLLFAIDDVHAITVAWLANRNHLISGTFILFAFNAHMIWQNDNDNRYGCLSIVLFVIALLAAELGTAYGSLVVAFAMTLHRGTLRQRIMSILPGLLVGVIWLVVYQQGGFGARFSGQYIDPAGHPWEFLAAIVERVPIFFAVFFGASSADLYSFGDDSLRQFIWYAAVGTVCFFGGMFAWLGRSDRHVRFWFLAALLAVLPICAGNFMDRILLIASFAGHGLLVRFFGLARDAWKSDWRPNSRWGRVAHKVGMAAIAGSVTFQLIAHSVGAAALLPLRILALDEYRGRIETALISLDRVGALENRDLIIVNPPDTMFVWHLTEIREHHGKSVPKHVRVLCSSLVSMSLERTDDNSITVRPQQPFIKSALANLYRSTDLHTGWKRSLTGVDVEVSSVSLGGGPTRIEFTFDRALESADLAWVEWEDGEFVPFTPPDPGTTLNIPARLSHNWFVLDPIRAALGL